MRFGQQYWSMIIKQAMDADGKELDPSDQELEGSPIAGDISSVNHRSPCSSAPPTEGKVQLSDEQKKKKKIYDHRHREKKKRQEDDIMDQLESLEKTSGDLERENVKLKWERDHLEVKVEEENRRILNLLLDNNAGQNTEININGESSMRLNDQREMNEVPITSSTVSRGNPSMNPQTLPQSTKKKRKIIEASERIEILKKEIVKFDENNAVLRAEAHLLGKTLAMLRNITAQMTTRKSDMLETFIMDYMLQTSGQRNTPFSTQLQLPFEMTEFGTGETGQPVYHPLVYQSGTIMESGGPAIDESSGLPQSHLLQGRAHLQLPSGMTPDNTFSTGEAGLPVHHPLDYQYGTTMESGGPPMENPWGLHQSHVPQGRAHVNQGLVLDDVTSSLSDFSCFDNE
ncbi:uncharacterized protein LOC133681519 isoform X3 [Populus nigra]|uniref:uncharacterized protein LOC133681519 isoform X3 n=2 Tax=Populus nigra TaxID=3691 RepID=UPI002B2788CE|nr:uncharacterized protein LOC133681519 isoform X3 [Populus nigra]